MCLGIPGQIVEIISDDLKLAIVEVGGVRRTVNIAFIVDEEHPVASCQDDWVLVHVGFAMIRIDEKEAAATLALLHELGELQADIDAMRDLSSPAMLSESRKRLVDQGL